MIKFRLEPEAGETLGMEITLPWIPRRGDWIRVGDYGEWWYKVEGIVFRSGWEEVTILAFKGIPPC